MNKPNVLILFTDDQRFDTIHALGNEQIITPNMDKLMENGTTFTQAHIPGGTIPAVCMPSRAMLNTGRTLFSIENQGQKIPDDHTLLGEVFKQQGYQCFGTGKWHNSSSSYARSFTCGDNIFFGGMHDHWSVPVHTYDESGKYSNKVKKVKDYFHNNEPEEFQANKMNLGEHSTDFIAEGLLKFLDGEHSEPFYAYTSFLAPHDPRTMPEKFSAMYDPEKIEVPKNFQEYHHIEYANMNCRDETLAPYPRTIENTQKQIAEYYAMISHLDYQIGRVIEKLEEKGLMENTIVILAGDNGLSLGQHGLFGKQNLYDHSVRVPLVFCGKGIPKGLQKDNLVFLSDIFPTLCEMLGFEIPSSVNCPSFAKAFTEDVTIRDYLYLAYTTYIRGVRKGDFKYVEHRFEGKQTFSFFDLKNDPLEMANLVTQERYADTVTELRGIMEQEYKNSDEKNYVQGQGYWQQVQ